MADKINTEIDRKSLKHTWKKTPIMYQMEATECGAVCLSIILGYYKCFVPLEEMRIACGVSRDGCNAGNILLAAKKYGLTAGAFKCGLKDLLDIETPCIIHWNFNHFVVFEGVKHNKAYINDPALGRRCVSLDELNDSYTGIVFLLKKSENFHEKKRVDSVWNLIKERSKNQKAAMLVLIVLGILLVISGIVVASFSKAFIDVILPSANLNWAFIFLIVILVTMLYQFFLTNFRGVIVNKFQMKLSLVFGYKFLSKMLKMPMAFYEQRYAGDLSQRIVNNDNANAFLSGKLTLIILDILTAIFYLATMFYFNWILALIAITGVVIIVVVWRSLAVKIENLITKVTQENGKLFGVLFSGLEISRTLKAGGVENSYVRKIFGNYSNMADAEQKVGQLNEILLTVPESVTQITNVFILMVGAIFAINGDITLGVLSAFGVLFTSFCEPIKTLFNEFQQVQNLNADLNRVDDVERQEVDEKFTKPKVLSEDKVEEKIVGNLNMKDVVYGYSKLAEPIIKDFSLSVKPGESVALVGASGCGKSTILKLISGLCTQWSGEIEYDGKNYYEHTSSVISSSLSSIDQEISIFSGTILENLTLWNDFVMHNQIIEACKDACIHDYITTLDGGYNYVLKHGGSNLSIGQRQCLEIARALVCNPSILIMDEATSSLDAITEQKVINNIKRRGCTTVMVAHRLSTVREADKIIYIEDGSIVESGSHDELIKKNGRYKKLVENQ